MKPPGLKQQKVACDFSSFKSGFVNLTFFQVQIKVQIVLRKNFWFQTWISNGFYKSGKMVWHNSIFIQVWNKPGFEIPWFLVHFKLLLVVTLVFTAQSARLTSHQQTTIWNNNSIERFQTEAHAERSVGILEKAWDYLAISSRFPHTPPSAQCVQTLFSKY